jgi:signal transduction histidine kinase
VTARALSLRSRIVGLAVGAAVAVVLLLAVPVTLGTVEAAQDEAEQEALTLALGVADLVSAGPSDSGAIATVVDRANGRRGDTPVTVVLADGTALGADQAACATPPDGDADGGDGDGAGRADGGPGDGPGEGPGDDVLPVTQAENVPTDDGRLVRVAAGGTDGDVVVCALVSDADVRATVTDQLGPIAAGGLVTVLLVGVAALMVARSMSRPLTVAAETADRLAHGDLDARVPDTGPVEVRQVGDALNRLAVRIEELLAQERETVADLSHRLRTPLMAVRLDVDSLPPSADRDELDRHVGQLERTLTAVIGAARRPQREGAAPSCDALAVVRARVAHWTPLLEDQARPTSLIVDGGSEHVPVRCAAEDLASALDALLENVVAHTAEGVAVEVCATGLDEGWLQVDVRDRGPGVPASAVQRGRSDSGSTGLGLDIARATAERTGGRLEVTRTDEWAVVRLVLGPA